MSPIRHYPRLILFCLLLFSACQADEISYSADIKPLLNDKCLRCHGGIRANGDFSLLFKETALAENKSGTQAIVPGKPGQSELIRRIKAEDPDVRMPQEGVALTSDEISLLEEWIAQGAKWDDHWSYLQPQTNPPELRSEWIRHDLDAYILDKIHAEGLTPATEADPHDLARRAALDLTGLPPETNLTEQFVAGTLSYEELIQELLSSDHFGEHWAAMWLDLARYADTKGYEKDGPRNIWRYRDWVIDAYNTDMSFPDFTIKQLAGDLLPEASGDDLIATAFHRNTMTNTEGGTEDEEYRAAAVIDRVNTTFEVWQGMTMSCVQCHSHPYDPIRHDEYYQLYDVFNHTMDADLDTEFPSMFEVSDSLHEAELASLVEWFDREEEVVHEDGFLDGKAVQRLLLPRLLPSLCDDFQDVLIYRWGCSNRSYNANNQKSKKFYLYYEELPTEGLTGLRFEVKTFGEDAVIQVRENSLDGRLICDAVLEHTEGKIKKLDFSISENFKKGSTNLMVNLINTSGKRPDGILDLVSIELLYGDDGLDEETLEQQDQLYTKYREGTATPILRPKSKALARTTRTFDRGSYLTPTDTVTAGIPGMYGVDAPVRNRLELAEWIVSDGNPLTSRVYVNRIWNQIFGRGLVETLDDFGSQAVVSPHRELLDYLAVQFSGEWGWSTKRLLQEILSSATYRQSVLGTPESHDQDPHNVYYSRASRGRLSAEQIRDQALMISGLLTPDQGGPSVMPPQPDGIWKVPYSGMKWFTAEDEQRYRRGLYTYWRRTTPYPSMVTFDSPSREVCVSRRINTNTPLQALVTLNDPVYIEAAKELASWMSSQDGNLSDKVQAGFKRTLYREPNPQELGILMKLYDDTRTGAILQEDEFTPLDAVANTMLNLDELLTKS